MDIKMDNVVLNERFQSKLIDFGHASPMGVPLIKITGTPQYMAPEIRNGCASYNPEQAEVFTVGVYLFIAMFQRTPFSNGATLDDPQFGFVLDNDFSGFFN